MNKLVPFILIPLISLVLVPVEAAGQCFLTIVKEPASEKRIDPWWHPVSLSVQAEGTPPIYYQWYRGAVPITGATNPCYQTPPIAALLSDRLPIDFWVEVSNACERIESYHLLELNFHWPASPGLVGAVAVATNKVLAMFFLPILAETATNFTFQPPRTVIQTVVNPSEPALVELTLSPDTPLSEGVSYTLTARGITDLSLNHNYGDVTTAQFGARELTALDRDYRLRGFYIGASYVQRFIVVWNGSGILQGAYELTGPWQDLPSSTSPYALDLAADTCDPLPRFFRLRPAPLPSN